MGRKWNNAIFTGINDPHMTMKRNRFMLLVGALLVLSGFAVNAQQLKVPAPSPLQTLKQAFGLGDITIEYSRPSVKGRTVFGDLVPYGKIWRTGANATTKITFSDDVQLEGNAVKAGTYGLYTIPGQDNWDILLYKDLTLAGNVASYKREQEVLRFRVKPVLNTHKVESLTINIDNITGSSGELQLMWDRVIVPIAITTNIDSRIMKSIETAMGPADTRPYFQAASYYYDHDKNMSQALTWVTKAIDQNPKAYFMVHLKAKIQMKLKDYKGAVETAQRSLQLAKEAKNDDYVQLNEKLIAEARKS